VLEVEKVGNYKFGRVSNCNECAYRDDCIEFWHFCPYSGDLVVEKRNDVEILEDVEVLV